MGWMDVINRIKDAVGLTDKQVAALERRQVLRVHKKVSMVGVRCTNEQVPLIAVDFGPRGVRVESARPIEMADKMMIYSAHRCNEAFRNIEYGEDPNAPMAVVVWTKKTPKEGMGHAAGLAFVMETEAQHEAVAHFLLDDCEVGIAEGREHRMAPRISAELPATLTTAEKQVLQGTVRDIAVGGALVWVASAVPRRTIVEVKVTLPGAATPLVCRGLVVRCVDRGDDGFELGLAFTVVPADHKERLVAVLSKNLLARPG